jgi:hypothetical protein
MNRGTRILFNEMEREGWIGGVVLSKRDTNTANFLFILFYSILSYFCLLIRTPTPILLEPPNPKTNTSRYLME